MDNLSLAFSVIFPLVLMMTLGYFLARIKLLDEQFLAKANKICFQVFLPIILFVNVYQSDLKNDFDLKLVLFALIAVLCCFIILMIIIPIFCKTENRRGVLIQGIFRSNYILFGIPIASQLFSESMVGTTAILIAFVIPLFNLLSILSLTFFNKQADKKLVHIIKDIITNPLIIGAAVAFAFLLTNIKLPELLFNPIMDLSKVATPLALMVLGGSFHFSGLKQNLKHLSIAVISKLIIVPIILTLISFWLGFRGVQLAALFALFASPTAVSSFTMAQSLGGDSELAGQIVVIGSCLSVVTIFLGLTILLNLGWV